MSAARFYCPTLGKGRIRLSDEEARHALASRRLKAGDEILAFNGRGLEGTGQIVNVGRNRLEVDIDCLVERPFEYPIRLTLATAVPKTPRQPFLVEKCTELGVAAIWPLRCSRSVAVATSGTMERWGRTAIEAAKQCGAAWVPVMEELQTFEAALARGREFDRCLLASSEVLTYSLRESFGRCSAGSVLVFVGPEGGWEEQELAQARASGAALVGLGPRILRIETACLAIAAELALRSPDCLPPFLRVD